MERVGETADAAPVGEMILWSPLDPSLPGPRPTPPPAKPAVTAR